MADEQGYERLDALREEMRARDVIHMEVSGIQTRFFDQQGALAACHRRGWFYEPAMLEHIAHQAREGAYLDVGANIGNHTVFFAQHCPATVVHAFEPLDFIFANLAENIALNQLSNVKLYRHGLGEQAGEFPTQMGNRVFQITCRRLDELRLTGPIAVVKVDIEGMESSFLRGAAETLRVERPLLYIEAHTSGEVQDLDRTLAALAYRRTGKVFNASPTYEFAPEEDPLLAQR